MRRSCWRDEREGWPLQGSSPAADAGMRGDSGGVFTAHWGNDRLWLTAIPAPCGPCLFPQPPQPPLSEALGKTRTVWPCAGVCGREQVWFVGNAPNPEKMPAKKVSANRPSSHPHTRKYKSQ